MNRIHHLLPDPDQSEWAWIDGKWVHVSGLTIEERPAPSDRKILVCYDRVKTGERFEFRCRESDTGVGGPLAISVWSQFARGVIDREEAFWILACARGKVTK